MTASELRDSLLRTFWAVQPAQTPTYVHEDVAVAVNQAFQALWAAPNYDYLRRRKESFSTVNGTASYAMDATLLQMIGPVTTPSWPLIPLGHKGDYQQFAARYLGADASAASGGPRAYYLERIYAGDSTASGVTVNLLLVPTPTSAVTVNYEAAFEPPTYTTCELEEDKVLPIPHGFVETLLLPIARWYLKTSHWFKKSQAVNSEPAIDAQYAQAWAQLGYADPQSVSIKESKPPKQPKA